jgi:hypothetical protein
MWCRKCSGNLGKDDVEPLCKCEMPDLCLAPKYVAMKEEELKDGYLYEIDARNASIGIWDEKRKTFFISRTKFYDNFLFDENHVSCPDFGTATPIREIEKSPFTMNIDLYEIERHVLKYLNSFEDNHERKRS